MKKIFLLLIFIIQNLCAGTPMDLLKKEQAFSLPEYKFRNGQSLSNLKIHYTTLGNPQKNAQGAITNAVLMLHWTNGSSADLLTDKFMMHLYAPGKPLDANRYYLIFPDNIGHGQSSKPSDGLKAQFPNYGYLDMVDLQHQLVTRELNISHLNMVIGTSMGGMHAWLWAENYPDFVDGVMPIVSLPKHIEGRNLIWRQIIIQSIKNDPEWKNGNYDTQPYSLKVVWSFARMLLDGIPHLEHTISDQAAAINFIQKADVHTKEIDANNLIYAFQASYDYAPESKLASIKAKVYALDFSDDQLNPDELGTLKSLIKRVKFGQAIIQSGTSNSFGHLTMAHPELWADHVKKFIEFIDQN